MTDVCFVTNQPLAAIGGELYSDFSSVRREVLLPARQLRQIGYRTDVVTLCQVPHDEAVGRLRRAQRVVFGKIFRHPFSDGSEPFSFDAGAYRRIVEALEPERLSFCISDDHFDFPRFAGFYTGVADRASGWLFSSEELAKRVANELKLHSVAVYPEPVESASGAAYVPRRALRDRLSVALARYAKVGLDPWRLRLLWFGHPSNVASVLDILAELEDFGSRVPLFLECVTSRGTALDARTTAPGTGFQLPLRIRVRPWSLSAMQVAFSECEAVLLPQQIDEAARRAKSNNRMIDALHAGRFTIASPLPAYEALSDYAWIGKSVSDGLAWLLSEPQEALRRLRAGQHYVEQHHSPKAIGAFWQTTLGLALPATTA